ncbi:MAG: ABC transporter permease [Lachnospiraceae bacterium]|nr:ABC transporter permease [Lachnospiraceae bacterium]
MKHKDLLIMCIQNLLRHRARTMLTTLGVIIGCTSVVIMISIGIGMKASQDKMLAEMGDLSIISVNSSGTGPKSAKLNDNTIAAIRKLDHVEVAGAKLSSAALGLKITAGKDRRYVMAYGDIIGIDPELASSLGYTILEGEGFSPVKGSLTAGQYFAYSFKDSKRPEEKNMIYPSTYDDSGQPKEPDKPYFDLFKTELRIELPSPKSDTSTKPYVMNVTVSGKLKEDYAKGSETYDGAYISLKNMKTLWKEYKKMGGQTDIDKKGYDTVTVKVDNINHVADVEKQLQKLGFKTSSMESIRKPMEQEARRKQLMFGSMGAISLFVAALGITNTMIMSITERTVEIGIMKSLGCFILDIRNTILIEAGLIGLIGGVAGTVLSFILSFAMNLFSQDGSRISIIPWWLSAFAILFSIAIGVGSGYYPAEKAIQIPALEAIKHT